MRPEFFKILILLLSAETILSQCDFKDLGTGNFINNFSFFTPTTTPPLPSDFSTNTVLKLTIGLWVRVTSSIPSKAMLRLVTEHTGDETCQYNKLMFLGTSLGNKPIAEFMTDGYNKITSVYGSLDTNWYYTAIAVSWDALDAKGGFYIYKAKDSVFKEENLSLKFNTSATWALNSSIALFLGGDTYIGNAGTLEMTNVIVFSDVYIHSEASMLLFD